MSSLDYPLTPNASFLPRELHVHPSLRPVGGAAGGEDVLRVGANFTLTLLRSTSNYPTFGLLTSEIENEERRTYYHTYSYLCSRCRLLFPVPSWVRDLPSLERSLQHHCHTYSDTVEHYVDQILREQAQTIVGSIINRLRITPPFSDLQAKDIESLGVLLFYKLEEGNHELWEGLKTLAREGREGR